MKNYTHTPARRRDGYCLALMAARTLLSLSFLLCICAPPLLARSPFQAVQPTPRKITGVVRDETGTALPGVTVGIKGYPGVATTDVAGHYQLVVPDGATVLVFSYVGRETREITLGRVNAHDVTLSSTTKSLNEVVVSTGYMNQRKADLTGAVTVVTQNDFVKTPAANVMRSLQGKVPGVFITTDGNPAENVNIQVRGITSINSSPALIVLDGQPVNLNLRDINPNDIESMQILKDAASASIYGSRAAGGVILITTKKGKKGETRITYDAYVGLAKITGVPKMLDAEGYGRGLWQATVNDGDDPAAAIRIYNYDWHDDKGVPVLTAVKPVEWLNDAKTMPSANTNWFNAGTRTGVQQSHQLTISGGGERLSSLFSVNYYQNQGTQITSFFRRLSARFNNDYELIKGRLTIGENLTLSSIKLRDVNSTYGFLVMPPNIPVHDNNGGWGGVAMALGMDDFNNPVRDLEINKDNTGNFQKILGSAYASLKILDNLTLRSQFGIDYNQWYDRTIQHKWKEAGGKSNDINGVTQNNWFNIGRTWTNTLTYNLQLRRHKVDVLGGIETYQYDYENMSGYRDNILLENRDYAFLSAATGDSKSLIGGGDARTLLSYFGKVNYAYSSRYLLSATVRRDGSSVFGANNRFSTFPAFTAGWRISEEKFMKGVTAINDLKLRASWGQNGNSAPLTAGSLVNIYVGDFDGTSYAIGGNQSGSIPSGYRRNSLGNPDLKWETTTQTNIGLDFALLDNRLSGSFDWFNKVTTDMLFQPPYIGALGEGGYRWVNAADMSNKGFELVLSWSETKGDFFYRITGNASAYKNRINSIPENVKYTYGGNGLLDNIVGRPLNSFYGLVADGIFKTQKEVDNSAQQQGKGLGRIRYKDLDHDGVINETYDRTWIGVRDPKLMTGLNLEGGYKGFDVTVFFQGLFGNSVYNNWKELSDFWNIGVQNDRNHPLRILDAWSPSNPNSDIPALSRRDANGEKRLSTYFIENGSFVKLRTVDLGYTFAAKLLERASIKRLRIYLSGQNLLTLKKTWGADKFTGQDPENPGEAYPFTKTFLFGVNVTF
ncbi:SusC/RagA family TonB-linked outer membrane protein [Chitinophaga parva]|nr:TonB-dependent receptor [Chitinophaga parva]